MSKFMPTHTPLYIAIAFALSSPAFAADFTILNGDTETNTQVLTDDGDTGIVEAGGVIKTLGGGEHGIYSFINNTNATITNSDLPHQFRTLC